MNIDQQLQDLIEGAPPEADLKQAIETVSPIILAIAKQLKHSEYYILQSVNKQWLQATITHKDSPTQPKKVVYAYPSLAAAAADKLAKSNPGLMALPIPVARLLFQLPSIEPVDSLIFLETDARDQAIEVRRTDLKTLFQNQLTHSDSSAKSKLPPNLA
ncbi:MAG: hypothetical protein WBA76_01410 [Phormidesmis sp.]